MEIDILNILSQYCFPIVACVAMAWYVKYSQDRSREDLRTTWNAHEAEIDKLTEAINNNTKAIDKLVIYIGDKDNER